MRKLMILWDKIFILLRAALLKRLRDTGRANAALESRQ
jgi:hypothetical protein